MTPPVKNSHGFSKVGELMGHNKKRGLRTLGRFTIRQIKYIHNEWS